MRTTLLLILSAINLVSCEAEEKSSSNNVVEPSTNYVLKEDIRNSATNLNEGDTLSILVDLSACTWFKYSQINLIKHKTQIQLDVRIYDDMIDTSISRLYPLDEFELDSILYTHLIDSLFQYDRNEYGYITYDGYGYVRPSGDITLSFNGDTIFLEDTAGLSSKLKFIDIFNSIMLDEFPAMEIFKPLPKPIISELDSTENSN